MSRDEERELRAAVKTLAAHKNVRRYDQELRGRIVAHAEARFAIGDSIAGVARSLDVAVPTLARFVKSSRDGTVPGRRSVRHPQAKRGSKIVPVVVSANAGVGGQASAGRAAAAGRSGRSVRGLAVLLVEGLSVDEVALLFSKVSACSG